MVYLSNGMRVINVKLTMPAHLIPLSGRLRCATPCNTNSFQDIYSGPRVLVVCVAVKLWLLHLKKHSIFTSRLCLRAARPFGSSILLYSIFYFIRQPAGSEYQASATRSVNEAFPLLISHGSARLPRLALGV